MARVRKSLTQKELRSSSSFRKKIHFFLSDGKSKDAARALSATADNIRNWYVVGREPSARTKSTLIVPPGAPSDYWTNDDVPPDPTVTMDTMPALNEVEHTTTAATDAALIPYGITFRVMIEESVARLGGELSTAETRAITDRFVMLLPPEPNYCNAKGLGPSLRVFDDVEAWIVDPRFTALFHAFTHQQRCTCRIADTMAGAG